MAINFMVVLAAGQSLDKLKEPESIIDWMGCIDDLSGKELLISRSGFHHMSLLEPEWSAYVYRVFEDKIENLKSFPVILVDVLKDANEKSDIEMIEMVATVDIITAQIREWLRDLLVTPELPVYEEYDIVGRQDVVIDFHCDTKAIDAVLVDKVRSKFKSV